jgi:hypothetical protein
VCALAQPAATADAQAVRALCAESEAHGAMMIGFGLGGVVLAAVGTVLVVTAPSSAPAVRTSLRMSPWIDAHTRGAALQVTF